MSDYVHPLRFVNTPTIKEVWDAEHGKEVESESTDEEVNELSDEYDRSTGVESFYQLMLKHTQRPTGNLDLYTGTEGFWDTIKSGVDFLVKSIKDFFKWLFSFFTSKKELIGRTSDKMSKTIEIKGVKEGNIIYPAATLVIWNATGKPPENLNWLTGKIVEVEKTITDAIKYKDSTKTFIAEVGGALSKHGQLHLAIPDIENLIAGFNKKLKEIFKEGPFIGLNVLSINKDNKIVLKRNPAVSQKPIKGTYRTDVSTAQTILKTVDHANDEYGNLTAENVKLEDILIKNLQLLLRTNTNFSAGTGEHAKTKAVADKVKKIMNNTMANLHTLEDVIHKSVNGGLSVVKAAVPADKSK